MNFSICAYHEDGTNELIIRPYINDSVISNVECLLATDDLEQDTATFTTILTVNNGDLLQLRGANTAGTREWFFSNYSLSITQI